MIQIDKIQVDADFLSMLKALNIFQNRSGMKRNEKYTYNNRFKIGDSISFSRDTCIEEFSTFANGLQLFSSGSFSSLASSLPLGSHVGRYVSLATGLKPMGFRHPIDAACMNSAVFNFSRENVASYFARYEEQYGSINKNRVETPQPQKSPIFIGNDVWIGSRVTITGGVTIGDGAVIASDSIVTRDVSPYSVVAGIPAKHRKYRFEPDIVAGFNEIQWWNYELGDIYREGLSFSNPDLFLEQFLKYKNNLRKLDVKKFYPYLYKYGVSQEALMNHVIDSHGNILYFDIALKKLIKSKELLDNKLKVELFVAKDNSQYFYIKGVGFLDIDSTLKVSVKNAYSELSYKIFFEDKVGFFVTHKGLYLSSSASDKISWQPHLKGWEYFYTYTKI